MARARGHDEAYYAARDARWAAKWAAREAAEAAARTKAERRQRDIKAIVRAVAAAERFDARHVLPPDDLLHDAARRIVAEWDAEQAP